VETKKKDTAINTIIGEDTVIQGNIKLDGNIVVYGKILGDIETDGTIRIGPGAEIEGKLIGTDLQIGGHVEGNVMAVGKVMLGDKSVLHGDMKASQIVIEEGAHFEGRCDMQAHSSTPSRRDEA